MDRRRNWQAGGLQMQLPRVSLCGRIVAGLRSLGVFITCVSFGISYKITCFCILHKRVSSWYDLAFIITLVTRIFDLHE
jgi:hypothetical protein